MYFFPKAIVGVTIAAALVATASLAASHSAKSSNAAVAARHAQMQMVAYNIGVLGSVAKGEMEFDAEMVNSAASNLKSLAAFDPASVWIEGTAQGEVDGSRAKAEIWSDRVGFLAGFKKLEDAANTLVGAESVEAVQAGMGALGNACKDCHEGYRGPKN